MHEPSAEFASTRWSKVRAAGQGADADARQALEDLCRTYWLPIYGYIRRRVPDVHQAQDLTQDFFADILAKNLWARAEPARGRFRAFLLTVLKHFLANDREKALAQKRGGGIRFLPLDFSAGDSRLSLEPADNLSPDRLFDRQWALTLLERVLQRLRADCIADGKEDLFERLKVYLAGEPAGPPYQQTAQELDMTEGAVKVAVHRLRQRYRELLRAEVADTLDDAAEVDQELRDLLRVLSP